MGRHGLDRPDAPRRGLRHVGSAGAAGSPAQPAGPGGPGGPGGYGYPGAPAYPGTPAYPAYPTGSPYAGGTAYPSHPGHPGHPGYPAYPAQPPAAPRRGLRIGIAATAAAVVLVSIGVGVYALSQDGGGSGGRTDSQQGQERGHEPGGSGGPDGSGGSSGPDESPRPGPGVPKVKGGGTVPDQVNGISLPVPRGWTGEPLAAGAQVTSDDAYKCPGNSQETCTAGGAYSASAEDLGTKGDTAEAVAKADIAANAEHAYGGTTYGSLTSHEVLASRAVTVAGQKGYLVRWKAVTSKGADGYVESVAFPSPQDARRILVVRFGLDVGRPTSVMDEILKGIEASSGDGSGQNA